MSTAPSRRKPEASHIKSTAVVIDGDIRLDLSSMQFTVGDSPHTLADCVQVAVRMWTAKYHRRGGEDRSAEIVSIVWELMIRRHPSYSPTNIAHWACHMLMVNDHLVPLGRDVQGKNSGHSRVGMEDCRHVPEGYYGNPSVLAQRKVDMEAFYASVDNADAKVLLDLIIAGHSILAAGRMFGWTRYRQCMAAAFLKGRYREFTFSTSRLGEFVRELRSLIKAACTAA